jgi:ABC-type antimicrobial peptide transport system permease subunit
MTAAITTLFLLYFVFEGIRESWHYHESSKTSGIKSDLHPLFTVQRFCLFCVAGVLGFNLLLLISYVFVFSFIHDGAYYWHRNQLNPAIYPKKFFDSSTTSTAFFEFSFTWRLILFIIGISIFITTLIYTT